MATMEFPQQEWVNRVHGIETFNVLRGGEYARESLSSTPLSIGAPP
jgi:hypothetical protein